MRLNLTLGGQNCRSGYVNRDPYGDPAAGVSVGPLTDLDDVCEDGECVELVALDILDFVPIPSVNDAVAHWVKKLARGGTIAVGGIDLREVSRKLLSGELDTASASHFLHGPQEPPWATRRSTLSLPILADQLKAVYGLEILTKGYDGLTYLIKARRT